MSKNKFTFEQNDIEIDRVVFEYDNVNITYVVPQHFGVIGPIKFTVSYTGCDIVDIISQLAVHQMFEAVGTNTTIYTDSRISLVSLSGAGNEICLRYNSVDNVYSTVTIQNTETIELFGVWLKDHLNEYPFVVGSQYSSLDNTRLTVTVFGDCGTLSEDDAKSLIEFIEHPTSDCEINCTIGVGKHLIIQLDSNYIPRNKIVCRYIRQINGIDVERVLRFSEDEFKRKYLQNLIDWINSDDASNLSVGDIGTVASSDVQ